MKDFERNCAYMKAVQKWSDPFGYATSWDSNNQRPLIIDITTNETIELPIEIMKQFEGTENA